MRRMYVMTAVRSDARPPCTQWQMMQLLGRCRHCWRAVEAHWKDAYIRRVEMPTHADLYGQGQTERRFSVNWISSDAIKAVRRAQQPPVRPVIRLSGPFSVWNSCYEPDRCRSYTWFRCDWLPVLEISSKHTQTHTHTHTHTHRHTHNR